MTCMTEDLFIIYGQLLFHFLSNSFNIPLILCTFLILQVTTSAFIVTSFCSFLHHGKHILKTFCSCFVCVCKGKHRKGVIFEREIDLSFHAYFTTQLLIYSNPKDTSFYSALPISYRSNVFSSSSPSLARHSTFSFLAYRIVKYRRVNQ